MRVSLHIQKSIVEDSRTHEPYSYQMCAKFIINGKKTWIRMQISAFKNHNSAAGECIYACTGMRTSLEKELPVSIFGSKKDPSFQFLLKNCINAKTIEPYCKYACISMQLLWKNRFAIPVLAQKELPVSNFC